MFAKAIKQDKEIKKIFYERIQEKVERGNQAQMSFSFTLTIKEG